jgi:putative toxin-antitoxin system antitoxin component (TIGR02293 family)
MASISVSVEKLEKQRAQNTIALAQETLQLNNVEIASALSVDRRTILRWRNQDSVPSPGTRARFMKMEELIYLLNQVFIDEYARLEWLHTPVPTLRGRQPIDLIRRGELDQVIEVLAGLHSGAFA